MFVNVTDVSQNMIM